MKGSNPESNRALREMYSLHQREFKRLFLKFYAPLCRYAAKIIQDKQQAKDLVNEVLTALYDKLNSFSEEDQIQQYLYKATDYKCKMYLHMQKVRAKVNEDLVYVFEPTQNEIIEAELWQALYEEIKKLPSQRKKILKQLYWENLSSAEVASNLNINQQTVRNQKTLALTALRKTIGKFCEGYNAVWDAIWFRRKYR